MLTSQPVIDSFPFPSLPFVSIVGMELTKRAMLLLAIDPKLKGVVVAGGPGSAKSILARSFVELVSPSSDKNNRHSPFVGVPLNASEEKLLGGFDMQAALNDGEIRFEPGLLSRKWRSPVY